MRDTVAYPVDLYGHPLGYMHDVAWRNSLTALGIVNVRAQVLGATDLLDSAALDPYTFKRDAFLQRRQNEVYDGNPPEGEERYDLEDDETPPAGATPGAAPAKKPNRRPRRARPTSEAPVEAPAVTAADAEPAAADASENQSTEAAPQTVALHAAVPAEAAPE